MDYHIVSSEIEMVAAPAWQKLFVCCGGADRFCHRSSAAPIFITITNNDFHPRAANRFDVLMIESSENKFRSRHSPCLAQLLIHSGKKCRFIRCVALDIG